MAYDETWQEKPSLWLLEVIEDIESNKEFLAEGVAPFAKLLFSMVECRDIPKPDTMATINQAFHADWTIRGDYLSVRVIGKNRWRYILRTATHKDGSMKFVGLNHGNKVRQIFEKMFLVNSVEAVPDESEGWGYLYGTREGA